MIVDVVGTEPLSVEYHKNVHNEKCTFVSRRHIQQTRCSYISYRSKSPGKDILDSNMTTGLMCAADVESTSEPPWECNPVPHHRPDVALIAHRDFVHEKCDHHEALKSFVVLTLKGTETLPDPVHMPSSQEIAG